MIEVLTIARPVTKSWLILREVRTPSGIARRHVPNLLGGDGLTVFAESAERAVENARKFVADGRGLIAVERAE